MSMINSYLVDMESALSVPDFKSTFEPDGLIVYPGRTPRGGFVLLKDNIYPIISSAQGDIRLENETIQELLARMGLPELEKLVPVVAYGANQSPVYLFKKFADNKSIAHLPVIALPAKLMDYVPVGHEKPSIRGGMFAELFEYNGAVTNIKLLMLNPEQVEVLNSTEPSYDLGILKESRVEDFMGGVLPALVYAGKSSVLLDDNHKPIIFSGSDVENADDWTRMTGKQMIELILSKEEVKRVLNMYLPAVVKNGLTPQSYRQTVKDLPDTNARRSIQELVGDAIRNSGHSGSINLSDKIESRFNDATSYPSYADLVKRSRV